MYYFAALRLSESPTLKSLHLLNMLKAHEKQNLFDKIVAPTFTVGDSIIQDPTTKDEAHLDDNATASIRRLLCGEGSFKVFEWIRPKDSWELASRVRLGSLQDAVNLHRKPLWQYMNEEDEYVCDIELIPRIQDIGKTFRTRYWL